MLPGFDNESVAISAMCCSFFFWCRALRSPKSWPIAGLAGHLGAHEMDFKRRISCGPKLNHRWFEAWIGCISSFFWVGIWNVLLFFDACARLAYSYMAASWGGYVFVLPLGRLAERWGMITRSVFNGVLTVWFTEKHPASKIRKTSSHYGTVHVWLHTM